MNVRIFEMARHNYIFYVEASNIYKYSQLLRIYLVKNVAEALQMLQLLQVCGALAELVYALDLGSSTARFESSSLSRSTKIRVYKK